MKFSKKAALILMAGLLGSGVLAGCGSTATESQQPESGEPASSEASSTAAADVGEKILTCGSTGYFGQESLDPAYSYDGWYWQFEGVVETMFQLDDSYTPQAVLVESYKQIDDTTWEFTLKDNVKFHNGEKMTADAAKKSFEHTLEISDRAKEQIYFDTITADGQVLTIKTKEANPTLLNDLCDPLWTIYDAENSDFKTTLYGTGPYMIESFEAGVEINEVRFDDYWGGTPKLDKVVCKVVGDADALTMALQKGEIDIAAPLPSASIPVFQGKAGFVIDSATGARANVFNYNLSSPTTGDLAVRKAVSLCIDREGICSQIYTNLATPSYGLFPANFTFGGLEGLKSDITAFDQEAAAKILDDAGWVDSNNNGIRDKDGVELSMRLVADSTRKELASIGDVLQSNLKEIGVELKVDILENSGDTAKNADFDISLRTFNMAPTGNPQYYLNTRLITGSSGNEGGFSNQDFDALAKKLEGTTDDAERAKIVKEATQIILDERPVDIFLHQSFTCVYNDDVKNFQTKPSEYYLIDGNVDVQR